MAKLFSSGDVRTLIREHQELRDNLKRELGLTEIYQREIRLAVERMVNQEVLELLENIPVEEINREKLGIRVKYLQDSGFENLKDLSVASAYSIANIKGISDESAYLIKKIVKDIEDKLRKSTRVHLSMDKKTEFSSRLVTYLSRYKDSRVFIEKCSQLLGEYGMVINQAIQDLAPAQNGFSWFFVPRYKKERAEASYLALTDLSINGYETEAVNAVRELERIKYRTQEEAWEDFEKNSIELVNLLEKILPGVLGNDDSKYGLPEEIAVRVDEEEFHPEGLTCTLRRYQEWGVKYILRQGKVLLGDEMGLGKTIQAIAVMVSLRNTGSTHFLVVCPASVLSNWCREIKKHSDLTVKKIYGSDREESLADWIQNGGTAVTTYETLVHFDLEEMFRFHLLVVDEAHYIKNPEAKRTINAKMLCGHADRILFMTGTALENRVDEMISLISMLRPELVPQIYDMKSLASAPQFRDLVAPVYYRRKREDVLTELPELIENEEWCTLMPEEEAVYEETIFMRDYVGARRVSWNVSDPLQSSKALRMMEIVDEAAEDGRKVLIFSFFLDTIGKIKALLGDQCMGPINGSVTPQRRQEIVDEFEKAPAGTVLAAQIQSGGTGLNIQAASVVILCEPQFKPSIENQAISRAYRMGQTRTVSVHRLLCEDTVDEIITDLLEEKQRIFDAFADESTAAMQTLEIDEKAFGSMIDEEIKRIHEKKGIAEENCLNDC